MLRNGDICLNFGACEYVWLKSVLSLLATQQPYYEKLLLESEPFLSAEEHTWRNFCRCEKYQQLIGLEEIQKNPFLAFP